MTGILVANTQTTDAPSVHYKAAFTGVSPQFRSFVGSFIDGYMVEPDGEAHDIVPIAEGSTYSRVACLDLSPGVDRYYEIKVWSRRDNGRNGPWDDRGAPTLLDDVRIDGQWQLYNCILALSTRSLSSLYPGRS